MEKGILKIIDFMWFGSVQGELLFACILKYINYYFGGSFGE